MDRGAQRPRTLCHLMVTGEDIIIRGVVLAAGCFLWKKLVFFIEGNRMVLIAFQTHIRIIKLNEMIQNLVIIPPPRQRKPRRVMNLEM